ncbi:hypothetical protein [Azospirillum sp. sgz301742]
MKISRLVAAGVALMALSACNETAYGDRGYYRDRGYYDDGLFGNSGQFGGRAYRDRDYYGDRRRGRTDEDAPPVNVTH